MGFLAGTMLWGAALAAVPIVLHLTMRRKPRHWMFPALRFVKERSEQNRRRFRLRHLLLLAARCGFVAILALAMARPLIRASGFLVGGDAPTAAAFVFDASARMQLTRQEGSQVVSRLDAAKAIAERRLAELPERSSVYVFDNREAAPAFPLEPPAAKQRIAAVAVAPAADSLSSAIARAVSVVAEADQPQREVYVFTDLAASAWSEESVAAWRDLAATSEAGIAFYVIDVSAERYANAGLGDLALSAEQVSRNEAPVLSTSVAAVGGEFPRSVVVELLLQDDPDQEPTLRRRSEVVLESSQAVPVEFSEIAAAGEGLHQGTIRIAGEDDLSIDDVRYFSLEVKPPWRVLVGAPAPAEENAYPFVEALAPRDLRTTGQAPFQVEVVSLAALVDAPLDAYSAIYLLDPDGLRPEAWSRLEAFVARGGGLGVVLGRAASFAIDELNGRDAQRLLPGPLDRVWRAGARRWFLAPDDYQHPLLSEFQPIAGEIPWDAFTVERYWSLETPPDGQARTVLRFSNDAPAMWERSIGAGRVMTFATPLYETNLTPDAWNRLLTGRGEIPPWPGVLLIHRWAHYLVGATDEHLNHAVGRTVRLSTPAAGAAAAVLEMPGGESLRQTIEGGRFIVSSTYAPGHYVLQAGGEEDRWRRGFSVNLPAAATDLTKISEEEFAARLGDLPYRVDRGDGPWDRQTAGGRGGSELYPLLALAAALLFASETWLSNRFYGDSVGAEPGPTRGAVSA